MELFGRVWTAVMILSQEMEASLPELWPVCVCVCVHYLLEPTDLWTLVNCYIIVEIAVWPVALKMPRFESCTGQLYNAFPNS